MPGHNDHDPPALLSTRRMLEDIAVRLSSRYGRTFTFATINRYVRESYDLLAATSKIPEVLPGLTARFAADRLAALDRTREQSGQSLPEVLFICDHNAGRSQMAAALLAMRATGRARVHSAGTRPSAELELHIVEAMGELGADLSAEYPKPLTDEIVQAADVVITVGCDDACPILPGKRYLNWTVPDPDGRDLVEVRRIRDELDLLVGDLLAELPVPPTDPSTTREGTSPMTAEKPSVLFVCVHNAGRSQMAAGFLAHLAEGRIEVRSAGSEPGEKVNPAAVEAMNEVGIDISGENPKILTIDAVKASDVCITMGCGDTCPVFPGKRYLDWTLEDPAGKGVEAVRPIRDEIERRVKALINELLPEGA